MPNLIAAVVPRLVWTGSVVLVGALAAGCDVGTGGTFEDDAQVVFDGVRRRAEALGDLSTEELRELWSIEYTSRRIDGDDLETVDELLNVMGRDRWDCYHVSESAGGRIFFFKRNRSNTSAYLSYLWRLGALAF